MSAPDSTSQPPRPANGARRHELARLAMVVLSILALLLTSSIILRVGEVRAADGPKKAVVVAGPVHSLTDRFKGYAKEIAAAAEAQGMEVIRIFHPYAPAYRVKRLAQGADLFVYVGHGNGWPSDMGPFQEDTKNGLGLDAADPEKRDPSVVVYKGANWLRDNIALAPDAVVILSHLSYASGNASSGMPIPTRDVAVQRVDNFANGFLSIGARVVWALGWQPGGDIVDALYDEDATMDAIFMTRYRDPVNPRNGWIDWRPEYFDSVRIPGARIHIDPDADEGYLRAVTGDLGFTTTAWRDAEAVPADTIAPVVSGVRATQEAVTIASAGAPVFTPNGDGLSDTIGISFELSEGAYVEVKVRRDGKLVRRWTTWAQAGAGTVRWDGRRDSGAMAAEGKYNVLLTPTDRAGNRGETRDTAVKLLDAMRSPSVRPGLFWARDEDALAARSVLKAKLTREATVSVIVRNSAGTVVRRGIDAALLPPGDVRFVWDGRNDAGVFVPDGRYTATMRVQRPAGAYAHRLTLRQMSFMAWTPSWTRTRGDTVTLKLTSAEPLVGKPVVTANQPGIRKYTVPAWKITRLSETQFKVVIKTLDRGRAGDMRVRVVGTDTGGGTNTRVFTVRLK